jgi:hypothetical protein
MSTQNMLQNSEHFGFRVLDFRDGQFVGKRTVIWKGLLMKLKTV